MAIHTREGFNGPLGEVTLVEGRDSMEVIRLATHVAALNFNIKTGYAITRGWSLKLVKQTTGLKTNDKLKHLARLEEMLAEAKNRTTYVAEWRCGCGRSNDVSGSTCSACGQHRTKAEVL